MSTLVKMEVGWPNMPVFIGIEPERGLRQPRVVRCVFRVQEHQPWGLIRLAGCENECQPKVINKRCRWVGPIAEFLNG